jgi:cell division septation protein DedD
MPTETTAPNVESDVTSALYRAAIGPIRTDHYLRLFTRFEAADRPGIHWNWAASLCTLNWMAFRRLWGTALAYVGALVGLALLIFGIGRLVFQLSGMAQFALMLAFSILAFVVPGLFGDAAFYIHCRKKMTQALQANDQVEDACAVLQRRASTRRRMIGLALVNLVLLGALAGLYSVFTEVSTLANSALHRDTPGNLAIGRATEAVPTPNTAPTPLATPASAPSIPTSAPPSAPPEPAAAASSPTVPASAPHVPTRVPTKAAASHYVINVGLFAKDDNASNAHAKLVDAGLPSFTQVLETSKGKRTRVRVGPFETEAQAQEAVKKIHALKLDAIIIQQ